jgi:hypothetical protein
MSYAKRIIAVVAILIASILSANQSPLRADTLPDSGAITIEGVTPGEQVTVSLSLITASPVFSCAPNCVGVAGDVEEGVFYTETVSSGGHPQTSDLVFDFVVFGNPSGIISQDQSLVTVVTGTSLAFTYSSGFGCEPISGPPPSCQDGSSYSLSLGLPAGAYVTPIPAALPLFASGLGFVGFMSRRSKLVKARTPRNS